MCDYILLRNYYHIQDNLEKQSFIHCSVICIDNIVFSICLYSFFNVRFHYFLLIISLEYIVSYCQVLIYICGIKQVRKRLNIMNPVENFSFTETVIQYGTKNYRLAVLQSSRNRIAGTELVAVFFYFF